MRTSLGVAFAAYLVLMAGGTVAEETVHGLTGEWSPYTTRLDDGKSSGNGEGYGLATEIVSAALQEMDRIPRYDFRRWGEVLDLLREGGRAFAFPYRKTVSREDEFLFSEPLFTAETVLFYSILSIPDARAAGSLEDLRRYKIGAVEGYAYDEQLEAAMDQRVLCTSELQAFERLVNGEVDILPAELLVGEKILQRHFRGSQHKVARLPGFSYPGSLHLIAPRGDPKAAAFVDRFDRALQNLGESGLLRELVSRYDMQRETTYTVRLIGPTSFPLAVGTLEKDASEGFLIPRGTRAVVIDWSPLFLRQGDFDIHKEMFEKSRVKIAEGPLSDRLLWVPNMFLSFE